MIGSLSGKAITFIYKPTFLMSIIIFCSRSLMELVMKQEAS
jgi:hypothetical protein